MIAPIALVAVTSAPAKEVTVPRQTAVVVQTDNPINSSTFHKGERLSYTVTNDVIVNGWMIAKAGDRAGGMVLDAQQQHDVHAGKLGHLLGPLGAASGAAANKVASTGPDLRVSVSTVQTFCGATIPLQFVRSEYHHPKRFGQTPAVRIEKGQQYVAVIPDNVRVCGERTTRTPPPIPPGALHSDHPN